MIFFHAQNAYLFQFFLRSRFILNIILIEIWPKNAKMTFTSTFNTFNDFLPPPPLTKSTPPKVKSWIRHWDGPDPTARLKEPTLTPWLNPYSSSKGSWSKENRSVNILKCKLLKTLYIRDGNEYQHDIRTFVLQYSNVFEYSFYTNL